MSSLGKHPRDDELPEQEAPVDGLSAPGPDPAAPAAAEANDGSDSDDDVGPMPMAPSADGSSSAQAISKSKRRRVVPHEKAYLNQLPKADRYYRSFMHRDTLSHVVMTKHTNFLLTASVDGHLKFWKKQSVKEKKDKDGQSVGPGIEFVKHYRAHLSPILACVASADGLFAATLAADGAAGTDGGMGSIKVFDVENFDMINMITLNFVPKTACWVHGRAEAEILLAVSEEGTSKIHILDGRGDGKIIATVQNLHRSTVHLMAYNERYDVVVSADLSGMIEYWSPKEPFDKPEDVLGLWQYKSSTDLYDYKKHKSRPCSITFSPDGSLFAVTSLSTDRQIRIFNFLGGKLHRKYDESLAAVQEMQQAASKDGASAGGGAGVKLDDMEFGRRLAVERELEKTENAEREQPIWDETGTFLIYPSLLGIKMVNVVTNRVARILGKDENSRFLHLALFQGSAEKKKITTVAMVTSDNPLLNKPVENDPILFCTAYKRSRFYLFGQEEPESDANTKGFDRDVYNERPTREEQTLATLAPQQKGTRTANFAIMHTDKGDIHLRLFPDVAPKAVENFVVHAKEGYYDGLIFHRVIKKFMIQTGDPLGDGTGGDSIWGTPFEDEFSPQAKHDRPYTLSMANAGPKTNGSQFFITTIPCTWLDNKHTVFGRAVSGLDTVHNIENVRVDKTDKPFEDVRIVNIDIS